MSEKKASPRICIGAFAGAHGVKGDARVKTFTETPKNIAAYGRVESEDGARRFTLAVMKVLKDSVALVRAPEITSREDAESLKGVRLYIPRAVLPAPDKDEYYLEDLVGLRAETEDGNAAGVVAAVYNFGAGDVLEIGQMPNAKGVRLIPFTKQTTPAVDIPAGRIVIARYALEASGAPTISNKSGENVSDDIAVDLDAEDLKGS
ncbi:ribosome maturation factor RimM [Hyphococcus sp.]|uniref:ribosome maturation factor RimM n=1 Tax=Hyphococcus sp. TaxID=2038636 RepID=UPI003CCBFBAB